MVKYFIGSVEYVPGAYHKKRPGAAELADRYIREWETNRQKSLERFKKLRLPPSICFSRKIGVGALEIADLVAEMTGLRVVDREILETIAASGELTEKTVKNFDERYPGRLQEFLAMVFGEKSYIMSDYARNLFSAIYSIAGMGSAIFVGRGSHLILPRDRVLAVRCISSDEYRIRRLARELSVKEEEAEARLKEIDREQAEFFKKVYNKTGASPYEFDLTINLEQLEKPFVAAELVDLAFRKKYAGEIILASKEPSPA